jgi:hypothetical protein
VERQSALCAATAVALTIAFGLAGTALAAQPRAAKSVEKANTGVEPGAKQFEELNPKDFDRSEIIDHAWWPLKPGMQWVYDGYTEEEGKRTPHRIIFTVTDLVKVIGGVRSRVIFDTDISDGTMIEQELTYFAQDKEGNVWHLGQYREVFETEFVGGRIWHVGNPPGSKAGIMMPADPKLGTPSFSEGYAPPPFNWTDRGRVYKTGQKTKVKAGSYDDVLVIEEFDAEHPKEIQLKYYAKGVGNVRVGSRGDTSRANEVLELVRAVQLDESELAKVRAKAMELEKRGSMFPTQPPMEHVPIAK